MTDLDRIVLAAVAAKGILGHNSAERMPAELTFESVQEAITEFYEGEPILAEPLKEAMERLSTQGLIYTRDSSYYGYGDHYVPGAKVSQITVNGLMALWAGT